MYRVAAAQATSRVIALVWPEGPWRARTAARLREQGNEVRVCDPCDSVVALGAVDAVAVRVGPSPWLGLAVIEALARRHPVIAVIGRGRPWLPQQARELGARVVIEEPLCANVLARALDKLARSL